MKNTRLKRNSELLSIVSRLLHYILALTGARLWDVNVTMIPRYSDDDFALTGLIQANYTSGKYVRGNASVVIEMRERGPDMWANPPAGVVRRTIEQVILSTKIIK